MNFLAGGSHENIEKSGRPNAYVMLGFTIFVIAILIAPIWYYDFLPMVDMPNHMARHYLGMKSAAGGDYSQYYSFKNGVVPNSAVDTLLLIVNWRWDPYLIPHLSVSAYIINFIVATMVLARVVSGKWSLWPLTVSIVTYNANFYWGFENYILSIPFAIYGIALWLALEKKSLLTRVFLFSGYAFFLYFLHFLVFAIFAIMAFGRELQVLFEQKKGRRWPHFKTYGWLAIPMVLPFIHMFVNIAQGQNVDGDITFFGGGLSRLRALFSLGEPFGDVFSDFPSISLFLTAFFAFVFVFIAAREGVRLRINSKMKGILIAMFLVVLLVPYKLDGVALVSIRYPFVLVAVLLAGTTWKDVPRPAHIGVGVIVGGFLFSMVNGYIGIAKPYNQDIDDLFVLLNKLPENTRVLPMKNWRDTHFLYSRHLEAFAVIERNAFIPTMFQGTHSLTVKPEWREYTHPTLGALDVEYLAKPIEEQMQEIENTRGYFDGHTYWLNWPEKFEYVLLLDPEPVGMEKVFPVSLIETSGNLSLYRVIP